MAETIQAVRFYNGGDAKQERMQYSALEFDKRSENGVRHFVLDAPKKGFFEVPREIRTEEGASQLLGLPREVMEKYGERGFVMIDKNVSDAKCAQEPFMANSDELGVKKGDGLWRVYCHKKIKEYEDNDQERIARGMAKARPSGFIIHCYKELGMIPPGADEERKATQGQTEMESMRSQLALLTSILLKSNPEALAAVQVEAPKPVAVKGKQ